MFGSIPRLSAPRITALVAFALLSIVLSELYLLPTIPKTEILENNYYETSRTSVTMSHKSYILSTRSGNKYTVPENVFYVIPEDDQFTVNKTILLRRDASITWCRDARCYLMSINPFNTHYISDVLTITLLVLTGLIGFGIVRKKKLVQNAYPIAGLAFGVFVFYMVY